MKVANADMHGGSQVKFEVQCYRSREYHTDLIGPIDEEKDEETAVYVVRMRRLEGTAVNFNRIKRAVIFERCGNVLTGLSSNIVRAKKLQRMRDQESGLMNDPLADFEDASEEDDYDAILAQDEKNQVAMVAAQ